MSERKFFWSPEWVARLDKDYPTLGILGFMKKYDLKIPYSVVSNAVTRFGLKMDPAAKARLLSESAAATKDGLLDNFAWTKEWNELLRQDYPLLGSAGFAKKHGLNIPNRRISWQAENLGIKVLPEVRKNIRAETITKNNKTVSSRQQSSRIMAELRPTFENNDSFVKGRVDGIHRFWNDDEKSKELRDERRENMKLNDDPEVVKRRIQATKDLWLPGGYYEQHPERAPHRNQRRGEYTDIELTMKKWLDELEVKFEHDKMLFANGITRFGDFVIDGKFIIECDGNFWHDREDRQKYDFRKDEAFRSAGFRILRVQGKNIHDRTGYKRVIQFLKSTKIIQ